MPVEHSSGDTPPDSAGYDKSGPELGEISLRSEGENNPTVKNSTPETEIVIEKMYEIRFAADEELMELIQWMRSHLSHKFPKAASFQEIFKCALSYIKDREDIGNYEPSRQTKARRNGRHIPKAIKKEVWERDGGRRAFIGSNGKRCNSDYNLQFDHHPIPYARGGPMS